MLAFTSSMANAEYTIQIPLELDLRGHLPNNSIVFVGSTEVDPETPVEETPVEETPVEETPVEETPVKYEPIDCLTNPTDNPEQCEKSLTAWDQWADAKNPPIFKAWRNLEAYKRYLPNIPNEPYPVTTANSIQFDRNGLYNVDGLSNLTSVGVLQLEENNLGNVEGLRNLTSVGSLLLHQNRLTDLEGLRNLTSVTYTLSLNFNRLTNVNGLSNLRSVGTLDLKDNKNLTNLDGIANVKVSSWIMIEKTYKGKKLPANTIFCTENPYSLFYSPYAQKSQVCESP